MKKSLCLIKQEKDFFSRQTRFDDYLYREVQSGGFKKIKKYPVQGILERFRLIFLNTKRIIWAKISYA